MCAKLCKLHTFDEERKSSKLQRYLSFFILHLNSELGFICDLTLLELHGGIQSRLIIDDCHSRICLDWNGTTVPVNARWLDIKVAVDLHILTYHKTGNINVLSQQTKRTTGNKKETLSIGLVVSAGYQLGKATACRLPEALPSVL